jgi:AcrR family transcriptional regulator
MSAAERINRESRREDIIAAAARLLAHKSVAATPVSEIVKAAGVAQGTFYLYFSSKDDVVLAVAEHITDCMIEEIQQAIETVDGNAIVKLFALRDAMMAIEGKPSIQQLAEIYHRPANRAVHDRMADRLLLRLAPILENVIIQGVAEGVFTADNPRVAAWLILGGIRGLELAFTDSAEAYAAMHDMIQYALRALGHSETSAVANNGNPTSGETHGS